MWWLETTGYHLGGLLWLIAIAVIFLIALVALIIAARAMVRGRSAMMMVRDREILGTSPAPAPRSSMASPSSAPMMAEAPSQVSPQAGAGQRADARAPAEDAALGDSLRILHERYARGEITREEYLQRRQDMLGRTAA